MRKNNVIASMVAVLLSCVALPIVHAQPSPYHYAQRSSYPFGCRDVASKKEVGRYHLLIQYRFTVNMSAEEGGKEYTPDYDLMNLEIGKYFSRYYSTSADKCDSIVFNARNGKTVRGSWCRCVWMDERRPACFVRGLLSGLS